MELNNDTNKAEEAKVVPIAVETDADSPKRQIARNWGLLVGSFAIIIILLAVIGAIMVKDNDKTTVVSSNVAVNTKEYQALFLTNGQVYFGKLSNLDGHYVTLSDIYYLQVQQNQTTTQGNAADLNSQSQVSLAKLGSELHGPEDKMQVASGQVLFWENMKTDSKVSQAITKYQAK